MKYLFLIFFFILTLFSYAQVNNIKTGIKYGLIKKDAHGYYSIKDTLLENGDFLVESLDILEKSWDKNFTTTLYTLNDCANFNIQFNEDGKFIYNNVDRFYYKIDKDSIYIHNIGRLYKKRITNLKPAAYKYSVRGDTLILTTKTFSLFYLQCYQLKGPVFNSRRIDSVYYNWGLVGGINLQYGKPFYELGIAKTEYGDNGKIFYSGDFYLDYNPFSKIGGFNISAYMGGADRLINSPLRRFAVGGNFNSYSNFDKLNIGIKPMIGYNFIRYKLYGLYIFYGYNIFLYKKMIPEISHNVFEFKLNIPLIIHKEKHISHQMYYFRQGGATGIFDEDL